MEKRKIYQALPDEKAKKGSSAGVLDESGQHYLYPQAYFKLIQLPREAQEALQVSE